jgi:hypothetical protein
MKTLDAPPFDETHLDDAELADALATVRRVSEEEYGPEAFQAFQAGVERQVKQALGSFVSAYFRMAQVLGNDRAYEFASGFLQRDDLKPAPRGRGKADSERTALLVKAYEAAPEGQKWARLSKAMPGAKPEEVDNAMRRVERAIRDRENRRAIIEAQRPIVEVVRDWDAIRARLAGYCDKR